MKNSIAKMKQDKNAHMSVDVNTYVDLASAKRMVKGIKSLFSKRVKVLNSLSPLKDITDGEWVIPVVRISQVKGSVSQRWGEWNLSVLGVKRAGIHKVHTKHFPGLAERNALNNWKTVISKRIYLEDDKLILEFFVKDRK